MLKINYNSPVPIYEQIVNGIKDMIETKKLKSGDSLPAIRSLASQLDIAINTVARAYMELEKMNLIESSGRKGSFVKRSLPACDDDNSKIFKKQILKLIQRGMDREEIEAVFKQNLGIFFD